MALSSKQTSANRRNALRSTGPKSLDGKRRSAVNATRHGLTAPLEHSDWAPHLKTLTSILEEGEGLSTGDAYELARRIVEYERNVHYQRERFEMMMQGKAPGLELSPLAFKSLDIKSLVAAQLASGAVKKHDDDYEELLLMAEMCKFMYCCELKQAKKVFKERVGNADRYLRRSANQLIKQFRSLSSR